MCGDVLSPHTGTSRGAATPAAEVNPEPVEAAETKPRRAGKAAARAETVVEQGARRGAPAAAARLESRRLCDLLEGLPLAEGRLPRSRYTHGAYQSQQCIDSPLISSFYSAVAPPGVAPSTWFSQRRISVRLRPASAAPSGQLDGRSADDGIWTGEALIAPASAGHHPVLPLLMGRGRFRSQGVREVRFSAAL
ncbi:hypothetical protein GCM10010280_57150 [Streptomyces pilosus]|uniref:Uncharacterized protein n=1 Tax=Streptomyces pilosus TaxID=28893 RepID=A0A918F3N3_9ACTN|nr:hypothetical protein GCM10010280_57150 [Streptomyces pilosus]